jgi:hypothetical protein
MGRDRQAQAKDRSGAAMIAKYLLAMTVFFRIETKHILLLKTPSEHTRLFKF